jgi:hypothetical protein
VPKSDDIESPEGRKQVERIRCNMDRHIEPLSYPIGACPRHLKNSHRVASFAAEQGEPTGPRPYLENTPGTVRTTDDVELVLLESSGGTQLLDRRVERIVGIWIIQREVGWDVVEGQHTAHRASKIVEPKLGDASVGVATDIRDLCVATAERTPRRFGGHLYEPGPVHRAK